MMRQLVAACAMALLLPMHAPADTAGVQACDVQGGPCVMRTASGLEITLSLEPRPVRSMQDIDFLVTLRKSGRPVTGAAVILDLSMPGMYMGVNQPKMREDREGRYRGRGVIPRCMTGRRTWQAVVAVSSGGPVEQAAVLFEVQ